MSMFLQDSSNLKNLTFFSKLFFLTTDSFNKVAGSQTGAKRKNLWNRKKHYGL